MSIHKFSYKDKNIVLDVNSSNVFVVDDLTFDCLDHYPMRGKEETIFSLQAKYKKEELLECLEELDNLIRQKVLYSPEITVDKRIYQKGVIKAMCLHVSHDCNLACKYCFASGGDFQMHKEVMSEETAKKAMDFLIQNSGGRRNLEVDFFGGEPLMNLDVVKKTVAYGNRQAELHGKNFRFTMTTNGVLLDDQVIAWLNETMDNVVLSIDGRKEVNDYVRVTPNQRGSYDLIAPKILKAAKAREEAGKDYYVRGTYTAYAADFAKDVKHLSDIGLKSLSMEPVVADDSCDYALKEEHLPEIYRQYDQLTELYLKRKDTDKAFSFFHFHIDLDGGSCEYKKVSGCGAGCEYVAVTPSGDIYPCHQFVGQEEFILGNVETGIANEELRRTFYGASLLDKDQCGDCWAKYFCGGGCHANAFNFNHDITKPYQTGCHMHRKRLECALYIQCKEKETVQEAESSQ